jgi:hypothetical protein
MQMKKTKKEEIAIAKDARSSYLYALNELEGPFPLGELAISMNAKYSLDYAVHVLDGPFPLCHQAMHDDEMHGDGNVSEAYLRHFKPFLDKVALEAVISIKQDKRKNKL